MLVSFIFSYLESFCVVFYLSFSFNLAQDATARDMRDTRDMRVFWQTTASSHKQREQLTVN